MLVLFNECVFFCLEKNNHGKKQLSNLFLTKTVHPTIIQRCLVFQNIADKLYLKLHAKQDMLKTKHCIVNEPG